MIVPKITDEEIRWIKQYRIDNECGLQEAKRVLLYTRIKDKLDNQSLTSETVLKELLVDIIGLIR